jgi:hypothetical protein
MIKILIFIGAVIWGSLSAQFLMQAIVSLIVSLICLAAVAFSRVSKLNNATGALTSFLQSIIFGALFVVVNWFTSGYIRYDGWSATSIAGGISFLATIICVSPQVPGKILLARMCAWVPYFLEASNHVPRYERITFARKQQVESRSRKLG